MPLSFRLTTIFYVMALIAAALKVFGASGILAAAWILIVWIIVRAKRWSWTAYLIMLGLTWCFFAALPLLDSHYPPSYRNDCSAHLRDITIALQNYHATYGSFPPLYVPDANGKPMHSWRVLILPFMEEKSLYNAYSFDEPWNGPNNSKLANAMPDRPYCCSGMPFDERVGLTTFFAVVGKDAAWRNDRPRTIWEFTDDHSQTIMVIECTGKAVNWMEPVDLTYDEALQQLTTKSYEGHRQNSTHFSDCQAGMADGKVQTVWPYDRPETAKALLTISGRDRVDQDDIYRREVEGRVISKADPNYVRQIPIILFIALALLPAFRLNRPPARPPARESSPW